MQVVERSWRWILLFLLLMPLAHGYGIDRAWLSWEGNEVKTIAPGKSLPGTVLTFTLSSDFDSCFNGSDVCALLLDAPDLAITDLRLDVRSACTKTADAITCKAPATTFSTTSGTVTVTYFGQAGTQRLEPAEATIAITLDQTIPQVASITTGYCKDGTCYVAAGVPTKITLTLQDSGTASFAYRMVFVGAGSALARVDACEGLICTAQLAIPCSDGDELMLKVVPAAGVASREDSLNEIAPGTGQKVVCAARAPEITDWKEEADGVAGLAVRGGSLTYTAKVRVHHGEATGDVNTTGIVNDTSDTVDAKCRLAQDSTDPRDQVCTWTLHGLQPGTHDLEFFVRDAVGNYATREVRATVLDLNGGENSPPPDFFEGQARKVEPQELNRLALEVAANSNKPYPAYITYGFSQKTPGTRILAQQLTRCLYKLPSEQEYKLDRNLFAMGTIAGNRPETHIMLPRADWDVENRIDAQIRAKRDVLALSDAFDVRCEVQLYVAQGNTLYAKPETENITFTIRLRESPLGEPGQAVVAEIQRSEQKLTSSTAAQIRKLEKWRQTADKVCGGVETMVQIHNAAVAIKAVGQGLCTSGILGAFGVAFNSVGTGIFQMTDGFLESAWNGGNPIGGQTGLILERVQKSAQIAAKAGVLSSNNALLDDGGWLKKICRQVNCRATADAKSWAEAGEFSKSGTSSASGQRGPTVGSGHGADTASDPYGLGSWGLEGRDQDVTLVEAGAARVLENYNVADPEKSLTGAIASACLGGVVYNLNKYQAIECGYLQCLKDQSYYGHSINVCKQGKKYKMCTQVVGEAMELPWIRMFSNVVDNVNGLVANAPQFLAKYYLNEACNDVFGLQGTPAQANCPDWRMTGCVVANSVLNALDSGSQTSQALGGIRNEDAAKQALAICDAALADDPRAATPYLSTMTRDWDLKRAAYERDAQARGVETDQSRLVEDLYEAWDQANPPNTETKVRRPDSWDVEMDGDKVSSISPSWDSDAPASAAYRSVDVFDVEIGEESYQYVGFEAPRGTTVFTKVKDTVTKAGSLFGLNTQIGVNVNGQTVNLNAGAGQGTGTTPATGTSTTTPGTTPGTTGTTDPAVPGEPRPGARYVFVEVTSASPPSGYESTEEWLESDLAMKYPRAVNRAEAERMQTYETFYDALDVQRKTTGSGQAGATSTTAQAQELVTRYEAEYDQLVERLDADREMSDDQIASLDTYEFFQSLEQTTSSPEAQALHDRIEEEKRLVEEDQTKREEAAIEGYMAQGGVAQYVAVIDGYESTRDAAAALLDSCEPSCTDEQKQQVTEYLDMMIRMREETPGLDQYLEAANEYERKETQRAYLSTLHYQCGSDQACIDDLEERGLTAELESLTDELEGVTHSDVASKTLADMMDQRDQEPIIRERYENAQQYKEALSVISDYAVKWAQDQGYMDWWKGSSWAASIPVVGDIAEYDSQWIAESFCNDEKYAIRDNDDGAIYAPSDVGTTQVLGTFGTEVRKISDERGTRYLYLTVAHVVNPSGTGRDYQMEIIFTGLTSCAQGTCPQEKSLTNGVAFPLPKGGSFASGQFAKTRIEELPGRYARVCVRFDQKFPDESGQAVYCRTIKEDIFDMGSPVQPEPTVQPGPGGNGAGAGQGAAEGWA